MKNKKLIIVFFAIPVLFFLATFWLYYSMNKGIEFVFKESQHHIQENQENYENILTVIFDEAKDCVEVNCQKRVSNEIHRNLKNFKEVRFYEGTYFIRLSNEGILEKLFLSGEFRSKTIDSIGERKVSNFLVSNKGGYLRGFRIDQTYSTMTFLKDFYSEAEIIIPVRNSSKKTIGAVVRVYGD